LAAVLTGCPSASRRLVLPTITTLVASSTLRERRGASSVSQPVSLAGWPRSSARPRQRYCPQPLRFLCLPRASSWRGSPRGAASHVAQEPSRRASCRLTCGPNNLESINMMACKCRVTPLFLAPVHSDPPRRLDALLCPFILTHIDYFP
jgi:hypothetical protein